MLTSGLRDDDLLQGEFRSDIQVFMWGGCQAARLPGWSANSSFSIASIPAAERGFVPAPLLTGWILHGWLASLPRLFRGSGLGFWRFTPRPLRLRSSVCLTHAWRLSSSWVEPSLDGTSLSCADLLWHRGEPTAWLLSCGSSGSQTPAGAGVGLMGTCQS